MYSIIIRHADTYTQEGEHTANGRGSSSSGGTKKADTKGRTISAIPCTIHNLYTNEPLFLIHAHTITYINTKKNNARDPDGHQELETGGNSTLVNGTDTADSLANRLGEHNYLPNKCVSYRRITDSQLNS